MHFSVVSDTERNIINTLRQSIESVVYSCTLHSVATTGESNVFTVTRGWLRTAARFSFMRLGKLSDLFCENNEMTSYWCTYIYTIVEAFVVLNTMK
jgi:hypothetical protein